MKRALLIAGSSGYGLTTAALAIAGVWDAVAMLVAIASAGALGVSAAMHMEERNV